MKEEIMKVIKELDYPSKQMGWNDENLFIHSDLDLLKGFKMPIFLLLMELEIL